MTKPNTVFILIKKFRNECANQGIAAAMKKSLIYLRAHFTKAYAPDINNTNSTSKQNANFEEIRKICKIYAAVPADATIILPVYNGTHLLNRLLPQLSKVVESGYKIIVIDDHSQDPEVLPLLEEFDNKFENVKLIKNDKNNGFIYTVNTAMKHVSTAYAIWLNTDVILPDSWIPRLLEGFYKLKNVASITPFTNAGYFFSYPKPTEDNLEIFSKFSLQELDDAFKEVSVSNDKDLEIFSGCGFCMAINMKAWNEVGELDQQTFGKGYGEENDWCLRAKEKGWKNILCPNLFIQHDHHGSFKNAAAHHSKSNAEKLHNKHPLLANMIFDHVQRDPFKKYRIAASLNLIKKLNDVIIVFDMYNDSSTSGAIAYREALIQQSVEKGVHVILIEYFVGKEGFIASMPFLGNDTIVLESATDFLSFIQYISPSWIYINNLAFIDDPLKIIKFFLTAKKNLHFKLKYIFHDFLAVCPSMFHLDWQSKICTDNKNQRCDLCAKNNKFFAYSQCNIVVWRDSWSKLLKECESLICPGENFKNIIKQYYPNTVNIEVVPHRNLYIAHRFFKVHQDHSDVLNLAFIGSFQEVKGSDIAMAICDKLNSLGIRYKLHIFGENHSQYDLSKVDNIYAHGRYKREELLDLLITYKIHSCLFLSICYESFSYTCSELISIKAPFVLFNHGSPAERLHQLQYPFAEFANTVTADSVLEALDKLLFKLYGRNLTSFTER